MKNPNILDRRVAKVLPSKQKLNQLLNQRKIRLYQGFDPTGAKLHLGHTIGLRKLMDFARLGHEVIFLFGTGTVLVGDPSQRDTGRKLITEAEIQTNIKNWQAQVSPIVDFSLPNVKIKQNGDWLIPLTLKDIIQIASHISAVQLFKRDSFQKRIKKGDTVWYHETMYPLLQGYDSVAMDVDLEIGGTDQEFNMLVGRELQRKLNQREKYVLTTPMINGTDGKPMSKSRQNAVWLDDSSEIMFGKLMSIPDSQIQSYYELLTDLPLPDAPKLKKDPLKFKELVAFDIVKQFHGNQKALSAQDHFTKTVRLKEIPRALAQLPLEAGSYTLLELCKQADLDSSSSQIKRVIDQGGVEWNGEKITDPNHLITPRDKDILKFGKRTYVQVSLS